MESLWQTACRPKQVRPMMVGTIVLMLYLIYPSVATSVLSLWKCEHVEQVGSIFVVDPETLCTDTVHTQWVHGLAVPSVVLYILGLPTVAVYFLLKFRSKLDEKNTKIRLGLLYNGYRKEHYLHEIWVVMRKLLIIVIGIFTNELQVLLALGTVAILLTHTVLAQPFQTGILSRLEIMLLSCCFLTLWVGGIFVVYPDCNGRDGLNALCLIAEMSVFFLNIFCVVIGIGTYMVFLAATSRPAERLGKCSVPLCRDGVFFAAAAKVILDFGPASQGPWRIH